jgi:hypothetical protein
MTPTPAPSPSRPAISEEEREKATGDACNDVLEIVEAQAGGSEPLMVDGMAVLALTGVQADRAYLDEELVQIYDENSDAGDALLAIAEWCGENGY